MKKLFLIVLLLQLISLSGYASATEGGTIIFKEPTNLSTQTTINDFLHVKVVKVENTTETLIWESDVGSLESINVSVPYGEYKLYVQVVGHRTIWELDNGSSYYSVGPTNNTVVSLWANEAYQKEVFAEAPWRVDPGKNIPVLVMVKDADAWGDYDLGNVEFYRNDDCDRDDNENDDTLLSSYTETAWFGTTVDENNYNLYNPGDWYGLTNLDPSLEGLNGFTCFHVVIRENGGILDPDGDAHSFFNVTISNYDLPTASDWYVGDTHYHSYYTDNDVEFGFPIEATVSAGEAIGLDWVTITDHSFDLKDSNTADPNDKWNDRESKINLYGYGSTFKALHGEEVSARNNIGKIIHFLVYGMEDFSQVGGSNLDFFPGARDEQPGTDLTAWSLEDVISNVTYQGGVGYGAHPAGDPTWEVGLFLWRGS